MEGLVPRLPPQTKHQVGNINNVRNLEIDIKKRLY